MIATTRPATGPTLLAVLLGLLAQGWLPPGALAGPKLDSYWQVDDLRPGMKGTGRTVMKGTKIDTFQAEVLGVLKNTSPGRDLVLCRLSGLDLEKTGVIAGMSGSPIYIDGKLVGAVAFAWAFGKEPIAGITPFSQMHGFVERFERRDLVEDGAKPNRVGLNTPIHIDGVRYDAVTVAGGFDDTPPDAVDGLWMVPLQTPLASSGFSSRSLALLRGNLRGLGLVPVQVGGVGKIAAKDLEVPLEIGGPLSVALITGDFDLSGMGTVTHIEGDRVYGWGHPFFGIGRCDFPLMTGFIHTIYPRQSISFKMGSPLRIVGVINADVSTCVAGWLARKPDMLPVQMTVRRDGDAGRTFKVEVVRQRTLVPQMVLASLTNSVDTEGDLPEEMTAEMTARIAIEGQEPIVIQDTFAAPSLAGGRAAILLYQQVANVLSLVNGNPFKPVRIQRIECETNIQSRRRSADIEAVEIDSDNLAPGDTLRATVFLRPYKQDVQKLRVTLKLPADLPEGSYTAQVFDGLANARADLRDNPNFVNPQSLEQILEAVNVQTQAKRTNLVVRVPISQTGVAVGGRSLPKLPPSMVQIIGTTRRTGAQTIASALVSRQATEWVVLGSDSIRFTVSKNKRTSGHAADDSKD